MHLAALYNDPYIVADMMAVRKRVTNMGISVVLPKTSDGRHADYAPAIVMALARFLQDPEFVPPEPNTPEFWDHQAGLIEQAEEDEFNNEQMQNNWWEGGP